MRYHKACFTESVILSVENGQLKHDYELGGYSDLRFPSLRLNSEGSLNGAEFVAYMATLPSKTYHSLYLI